jgi:hypothetical protein
MCGCDVCGCAYLAGKFPFPDILRSEQKVVLCAANNASVTTNCRLFTSGFHLQPFFSLKLYRTLYSKVRNRLQFRILSFSSPHLSCTKLVINQQSTVLKFLRLFLCAHPVIPTQIIPKFLLSIFTSFLAPQDIII